MQDNVSVLLATIMAVVIIVVFPIYNIATRTDSIANNMVVKATTTFADEVRNRGYIDEKSYEEFIEELAKTGNIYDVDMEVYKPMLLDVSDEAAGEDEKEYKEHYEIEYTADILKAMTSEDTGSVEEVASNNSVVTENVYLLNEGYKFYVRVKNRNITQAQVLLDRLLGGTQKERIIVNYGGLVYANGWEQGEEAEELSGNISISRPLDSKLKEYKYEYITDVYDQYLEETRTIYGIAIRLNDVGIGENEIKFRLKYNEIEKIAETTEAREAHIKSFVELEGFDVEDRETGIIVDETKYIENTEGTCNCEYIITLKYIDYDFEHNPYIDGRVKIKAGSASTKAGLVTEVNSKSFIIFYDKVELILNTAIEYYRYDDTYIEDISGLELPEYARIRVGTNKPHEMIEEVRWLKGTYEENDFRNDPNLGTDILITYDNSTNTYITDRVTEDSIYTIYVKDKVGREQVVYVEITMLTFKITPIVKYYKNDGTEVEWNQYPDYASVAVKVNRRNDLIDNIRYVPYKANESDFRYYSYYGYDLKNFYDSTTKTYIIAERVTGNARYSVYAKDNRGNKDFCEIKVVGLGPKSFEIILNGWWRQTQGYSMSNYTVSFPCYNLDLYLNVWNKSSGSYVNIDYNNQVNIYTMTNGRHNGTNGTKLSYSSPEYGEFYILRDRYDYVLDQYSGSSGWPSYENHFDLDAKSYLAEELVINRLSPGNIYLVGVKRAPNEGWGSFDFQDDLNSGIVSIRSNLGNLSIPSLHWSDFRRSGPWTVFAYDADTTEVVFINASTVPSNLEELFK